MAKHDLPCPRGFGDGEIINVAPGYNQAIQDILNLPSLKEGE